MVFFKILFNDITLNLQYLFIKNGKARLCNSGQIWEPTVPKYDDCFRSEAMVPHHATISLMQELITTIQIASIL